MNFFDIDWSYIMDVAIATIIGALIAVAGSIIVNWFGNRKGYKDIDSKIGTLSNTTLSGQHTKITNDVIKSIEENTKDINNKIDIKTGSLDNTSLSRQNEDIIKKVDNITRFLENERDKNLHINDFLSYDMQKINSSISNLSGFSDIMKNIAFENSALKAENNKIKTENEKLSQENQMLKNQLMQHEQSNCVKPIHL